MFRRNNLVSGHFVQWCPLFSALFILTVLYVHRYAILAGFFVEIVSRGGVLVDGHDGLRYVVHQQAEVGTYPRYLRMQLMYLRVYQS